jgi:hypothetical protein
VVCYSDDDDDDDDDDGTVIPVGRRLSYSTKVRTGTVPKRHLLEQTTRE